MEQLKKYFYYFAGTLSEKLCVRGRCSVFGRRCPHSVFQQLQQFSEDLACSALADTDLAPVGGAGRPLEPAQLTSLATNTQEDYCCHNTTSPSYNSTFIEVNTSISISLFLTLLITPRQVLGSGCFRNWRDVRRQAARCGWTDWVRGSCVREQRHIYRLCLVPDGGCNNVVSLDTTENKELDNAVDITVDIEIDNTVDTRVDTTYITKDTREYITVDATVDIIVDTTTEVYILQ